VPAVLKLSPVPDESMLTASIDREPSWVLKVSTSANSFIDKKCMWMEDTHSKFVTSMRNYPSAVAAAAVEVSRLSGMSTLPQGDEVTYVLGTITQLGTNCKCGYNWLFRCLQPSHSSSWHRIP
jgi:hypothetical protein